MSLKIVFVLAALCLTLSGCPDNDPIIIDDFEPLNDHEATDED
ncbi:unnamed protein product, partial [marine sediment metagenome]